MTDRSAKAGPPKAGPPKAGPPKAGAPEDGGSTAGPGSRRPPSPEAVARPNDFVALLVHLGQLGKLSWGVVRALLQRPFEGRETIYQMEALGVRSLGIASVVALFTGLVMATQFAYGLQKFGGMEYTGRIIGLSFSRELAPSLTAVVVGGRIGSGITAEIGSMQVTEQIDAIRALGADPIKKLVVPRLLASVVVMPILAAFALVLGFAGAMVITDLEFGLPMGFFLQTALESVRFADYLSGMFKTPFFGAIIALVGCHYGFSTRGGTQGVGDATTRSVVAISVGILVSDFVLTKLTMLIWPASL